VINHAVVSLALRTRGLALAVCTTGSTSLSATATGYARASGSFVTDGFVEGMEVTPASFTQTTPGLVTAVTASTLTIYGGRTAQAAASGRTLSVELPAFRVYDNRTFARTANRWYVEAEYSPSTVRLSTVTASRGYGEATGEFYWRLYGVAGMGDTAFHAMATALLALYPPGDGETLSNGAVLHIANRPGPRAGNILPDDPGFAVLPLTIPWRCSFTNPVL
jgi:hypothetical protein